MPTKNLEQLVMTRALVKEEIRQGKWDQGSWTDGLEQDPKTGLSKVTCGTTACVAGWAVIADGAEFVSEGTVVATAAEIADPDLSYEVFEQMAYAVKKEKYVPYQVISVSVRARRLLGLDEGEAILLFNGHNSEQTVMRLLGQYIKEARKDRKKAAKKENAR